MIRNAELVQFANGNTDFYESVFAYFCDGEKSSKNKDMMQTAFMAEVENKANVVREGMDFNAWANHPSVKWATMAIVDKSVRAILPTVVLPDLDIFTGITTAERGDLVKFTIPPRGFYTVSKGGKGERESLRQRKFAGETTIAPVEHKITVFHKMYNVLASKDNIADFIDWVITSVRAEMYKDAIAALNTGLAAIPSGTMHISGAFDVKQLLTAGEQIKYLNGGVTPVFAGSPVALLNVVPDSVSGYRLNVDGEGNGKIGALKDIMGYPILPLENAVGTDGKLVLPGDRLYIVSPSQDKLVKGVYVTTLTNQNDYYMNADLTADYTMRLEWNFEYFSAAYAGVYDITQ